MKRFIIIFTLGISLPVFAQVDYSLDGLGGAGPEVVKIDTLMKYALSYDLVGTWKLKEVFVDTVDESGTNRIKIKKTDALINKLRINENRSLIFEGDEKYYLKNKKELVSIHRFNAPRTMYWYYNKDLNELAFYYYHDRDRAKRVLTMNLNEKRDNIELILSTDSCLNYSGTKCHQVLKFSK